MIGSYLFKLFKLIASHRELIPMFLDAGPKFKWEGCARKGIRRKVFLPKTYKCVMVMNPCWIGCGPGCQRPPHVSHGKATVEIILLLGLGKTKGEREEEGK